MGCIGAASIPYRIIEQEQPTTNLAIILPGAGYTTQAPLLYYTTGLLYGKGFDVLHINYKYNSQELSALKKEDFAKDVLAVIEKVLKNKEYKNFYFAAKSIGTIALSYLLENPKFYDAKAVWLTPLLQRDDVFNAMKNTNNKGLCIIGDQDSCCITDRFEALKKHSNLTLRLIEGGDHGLELSNQPVESINILKEVIADINEF
ncbi:alpha/beta family hydrolase [Evansella clarkii]|uniref:alpha/beta family hydrolase n=1 Tax=Evansella clarkii TaxID=79879 RepID=UPI000B447E12|nr:alpha/beta family hydrolase [Evansella clarkii]